MASPPAEACALMRHEAEEDTSHQAKVVDVYVKHGTTKDQIAALTDAIMESLAHDPRGIQLDFLQADSSTLQGFRITFQGADEGPILIQVKQSTIVDHMNPDFLVHPNTKRPCTSLAMSRIDAFVQKMEGIVTATLAPVIKLQKYVKLKAEMTQRPTLQPGHSRIEWTCSCGDVLHGDYIEVRPGSVQSLARQLGGRVIAGPAFHSGENSELAQLHGPENTNPSQPAGETGATGTQQSLTGPQWLELCIRSGQHTTVLGEVDLSTIRGDVALFSAIKAVYQKNRVSKRFGLWLAYRVPAGGTPVRFVKYKLATPQGDPPMVVIIKRPSMPDEAEAQRHCYRFEPMPTGCDPIDSETFARLLLKPSESNSSAVWLNRIPKLHAASLYWNKELPAEGWGFEIVEKRNWALLAFLNITVILVNVAIGSYISRTVDIATGLQLGTVMTAVLCLIVSFHFWAWSA